MHHRIERGTAVSSGEERTGGDTSGRRVARRGARPTAMLTALGVALLALAGCHHHHDDHVVIVEPHPTAFASETEFTWTGDLIGYSARDEYLWDTVWDEAFVEFTGLDFFGEVRIEIYDEFFDKIFDETYFGSGGDIGVNTATELGFSGTWSIVITTYDVHGAVTLVLD